MYICICHSVTEREIRSAVDLGMNTPEAISSCLGAGTSCGRCQEAISNCVERFAPEESACDKLSESA